MTRYIAALLASQLQVLLPSRDGHALVEHRFDRAGHAARRLGGVVAAIVAPADL